MPIINHDDVPWNQAASPGRSVQKFVIGSHCGARGLSIGIAVIAPGEGLPLHTHDVEEFTMILEGEGTELLGDATFRVTAGTTILVPAGVPHRLINTGDLPLHTVFGYPALDVTRKPVEAP